MVCRDVDDGLARFMYSPEVQVQRLMERNGYSKEDALARIHSQMLLDDKRPYADVIINNDGTPDELYIQLENCGMRNYYRCIINNHQYIYD